MELIKFCEEQENNVAPLLYFHFSHLVLKHFKSSSKTGILAFTLICEKLHKTVNYKHATL